MKHTHGEWVQESTNVMTSARLIANCNGNGSKVTDEDLNNAKLIAAAPNMLEALIEVLPMLLDTHDTAIKIKYAINKATI